MNVKKFCLLLHEAQVGKNDKTWFPRWIRRYASMFETSQGKLVVTEANVIRFLQTLRDHGTPAWQRLQAARAVECYRDLVLKTQQPAFHDIRKTLSRLADRERDKDQPSGISQREVARIGQIDPREPPIVQQMRRGEHYWGRSSLLFGSPTQLFDDTCLLRHTSINRWPSFASMTICNPGKSMRSPGCATRPNR